MTTVSRDDVLNAQSEDAFQRQVITWAVREGWLVTAMKDSRALWWGANPGFPDLFMVRRDRALAIELKVRGRQLRMPQRAWQYALTTAGIPYYLFRPEDEMVIKAVLA